MKYQLFKHRLGQALHFTLITSLLCAAPIHQAQARKACTDKGSVEITAAAIWVLSDEHGYHAPLKIFEDMNGVSIKYNLSKFKSDSTEYTNALRETIKITRNHLDPNYDNYGGNQSTKMIGTHTCTSPTA